MLINAYLEAENVYCAACADREITREATELCIGAGHTGFFSRDKESYSNKEKLAVYKTAFADAGLTFREELADMFPRDILMAEKGIAQAFSRAPQATCAICADDVLAVGAVKAALAAGRRIPEDFSVVGFNNSLLSLCTTPELISINSKVEVLCKSSVNILNNVFGGREASRPTVLALK